MTEIALWFSVKNLFIYLFVLFVLFDDFLIYLFIYILTGMSSMSEFYLLD